MLYGIISNMAALLRTRKYGAINEADSTALGYYVVKYASEPFTLQAKKRWVDK